MNPNPEHVEIAASEHDQAVHGHDEHVHIPIFVDGTKRVATKPAMTGAEIKALGEVPADYQLFLEVPGPGPDQGIRDDEVVELKPGMHFVGVVAGTLGMCW